MFFGYYKNFAYEDFKQYLLDKKYNELINGCYYSSNQEDILGYLESHLHLNHFIINYVYVRNHYQNGNFKNKDNRFKINLYGRDNSNYKDVYFNDFYTGLFSFSVDKFKEFIKKSDLKKIIIPPRASLEKLTMNFAYDNLESFKIINRLGILRYNTYDSLMYPTYY